MRESGCLRRSNVDAPDGVELRLRIWIRVTLEVFGESPSKLLNLERVSKARVKERGLSHRNDLCNAPESAEFVGIQNAVAVVFLVGASIGCGVRFLRFLRCGRQRCPLVANALVDTGPAPQTRRHINYYERVVPGYGRVTQLIFKDS